MRTSWNPWILENWSVPESEWSDPNLPLVTLGVLNYNRCEELRRTLDVLTRAVQYPNYEIIVVDNGSTDGSIEMVRNEFPSVILHEVGENCGVSSRNIQARLARGKYLFSFDNDSIPSSPSSVFRMVRHMELHPDLDAMSTACYRPLEGILENEGWEGFNTDFDPTLGYEGIYIVEGGICFRLAALRTVSGYDPSLFYGSEGLELGLQLFKQHRQIRLCPWFVTLHFASPVAHSPGDRAYGNSRHMVWIIGKHWPLLATVPLLTLLIGRRALAMAMHPNSIKQNCRGLIDGLRGLEPFLQVKPKLSWRQVFYLKRFYFLFFRWA